MIRERASGRFRLIDQESIDARPSDGIRTVTQKHTGGLAHLADGEP
jgi:hypothetical protein